MSVKPVQSVYYAFDASKLHPCLAAAHEEFARQALTSQFSIPPESVKVVPRFSGKETSFQLTCYVSKSETSVAAMALAAKRIVPDFRECQRRTRTTPVDQAEQTLAVNARWYPGTDSTQDHEVLQAVSAGRVAWLTADQQSFVRSRAAVALGLSEPSLVESVINTMTIPRLAKALCWLQTSRPRTPRMLRHA